jgi:hypothetical protein
MPDRAENNGARKPRLESGSPESALPHVRVDWTERELAHLAELLSSEPAKLTDALIRAMKG